MLCSESRRSPVSSRVESPRAANVTEASVEDAFQRQGVMCHWEATFDIDGEQVILRSHKETGPVNAKQNTSFAFGDELTAEQQAYFDVQAAPSVELSSESSPICESRAFSLLEELAGRSRYRSCLNLDLNLTPAEWFSAYMMAGAVAGIFVSIPVYVTQIYSIVPGLKMLFVDPVYTTFCLLITIAMTVGALYYIATECPFSYFMWATVVIYYAVGIGVTLGGGYFPTFSSVLVTSTITGSLVGACRAVASGYSPFK